MTQFHARFARVECEVVFGFQGPRVAEERRAMAADDVGPSYARSVCTFRKVGFEVEPDPVDWRTGDRDDLLKFSDHFVERLSFVDTATREWTGLVAYWITGKSSEFFPGPNER